MGLFSRTSPPSSDMADRLEKQEGRVRAVLQELRDLEMEVKKGLRELAERVDDGERTVRLMAEEMDERIDRGNKVWRKIRASEYYEANRENGDEDEDAGSQLYLGDGEGSPGEGVYPLQSRLGISRPPRETAREVGKALARRMVGLE